MIQVLVKQDKLTTQDEELINRILKIININNYKVINLKYFRVEINNSFFIIFGEDIKVDLDKTKLVILPKLINLYDTPKNINFRQETYNKLINLSSYIKLIDTNQLKFDIKNIPDYSINDLLILSKNFNDNKINILDKNGNELVVVFSGEINSANQIKFSELVAINLAKNVFSISSK